MNAPDPQLEHNSRSATQPLRAFQVRTHALLLPRVTYVEHSYVEPCVGHTNATPAGV